MLPTYSMSFYFLELSSACDDECLGKVVDARQARSVKGITLTRALNPFFRLLFIEILFLFKFS